MVLEGDEDGGAAEVAVVAQDVAAFLELIVGQRAFDGFDDVATTGMGEDLVDVSVVPGGAKQLTHGLGGNLGNGAMQLVLELSLRVHEPDLLAIFRLVDGLKILEAMLGAVVAGGRSPDGGAGAITKQTEADEHAGIVIHVKRGGANLHGDDRDSRFRIGTEISLSAAKRRDGGTAAKAYEVLKIDVVSHAELFRQMAGDAGANVTGASANKEGVDLGGWEVGLFERFFERVAGNHRGKLLEFLVQLTGVLEKDFLRLFEAKVTLIDPGIARQNLLQERKAPRF